MVLEQETHAEHNTFPDAWKLEIEQTICADVQAGLDREWLVTNGLGGYASGSIVGATTRCYHGLLVAALHPPVARTVLVTKIDEEVTLIDGQKRALGVNEYVDGTLDPQGYKFLHRVTLEGDSPCFLYRLSDTLFLEKRIWMEYGQNTTYIQYTLRTVQDITNQKQATTIQLLLRPFCLSRDYHSTTQGNENWHFLVENQSSHCRIQATTDGPLYHIIGDPEWQITPSNEWYWHVYHRRDNERGLADHEDVYVPGIFTITLTPGVRKTIILSAEQQLDTAWGTNEHEKAIAHAFMHHQRRIRQLLVVADSYHNDIQHRNPVLARLVIAADQFIVARPDYSQGTATTQPLRLSPDRKTIIAGYPWFTDWGRDSMISLPGLLLYTGRYSEARGLLKAFISFTHNGLIPNRFPDSAEPPVYNTVDATLWLFHALDRYFSMTGDWSLLKEIFPVLSDIIQWHIHGTDYGIHVDPADGLLHAGAPDIQLTWMDAKVDNWVVTPRRGKPVEVNALWYYALTMMENWAVRLSVDATLYSQLRTKFLQNFALRYWCSDKGYLYDVIDVDGIAGQNDATLRPNQLFAASLTHDLLTDSQVKQMLQQITDHLLTPVGLRSLSPDDPQYHNHFKGDRWQRDSAYHQGTVWQWLIGPYVNVHWRVYNDRAAIRTLLQPLIERLWTSCLGTISEVAEPEAPFLSGGCFAQAWSVAELLRCWKLAYS